jgi:hypothetical protein
LRIDHLLLLPPPPPTPPPTFHIAGGRNGDWGRVYSGLRVSVANRDLVPASWDAHLLTVFFANDIDRE